MAPIVESVLRETARRGGLRHVLISRRADGSFQASYLTEGSSCVVSIREDPILALLEALSPPWGHPWAERVGEDLGPQVEALVAALRDAEDVDLAESVL